MIVYNKLWKLCEEKGISTYFLRQNGVNPHTMQRLQKGGDVSTTTINRLCELIHCQPGDMMEYIEK